MSKIDDYKKIRELNQRDIENLNRAMGLKPDVSGSDPKNDKGEIIFCGDPMWSTDLGIYMHASYRYYSASDEYSATSINMKNYILRSLENMKVDIVKKAQELMLQDIEVARKAAEDEAREERQQGCKYCNGDDPEDLLAFGVSDDDTEFTAEWIEPPKFCPMCGRKLKRD